VRIDFRYAGEILADGVATDVAAIVVQYGGLKVDILCGRILSESSNMHLLASAYVVVRKKYILLKRRVRIRLCIPAFRDATAAIGGTYRHM